MTGWGADCQRNAEKFPSDGQCHQVQQLYRRTPLYTSLWCISSPAPSTDLPNSYLTLSTVLNCTGWSIIESPPQYIRFDFGTLVTFAHQCTPRNSLAAALPDRPRSSPKPFPQSLAPLLASPTRVSPRLLSWPGPACTSSEAPAEGRDSRSFLIPLAPQAEEPFRVFACWSC